MSNKTNPLKRARTKAGHTQKWLAINAQVPTRSIQKAERGEISLENMTARNILAMAKALEVDPYILVYGKPAEEVDLSELPSEEINEINGVTFRPFPIR